MNEKPFLSRTKVSPILENTLMQEMKVIDSSFTFSDCHDDILRTIFHFLDALTLIEVTRVNKACYTLSRPLLPYVLFERYNTHW